MTWSRDNARQQYNLTGWSAGYFDVGENGHLVARPDGKPAGAAVDLYDLAQAVRDAGLSWPVLLRFTNILHRQVDRLCAAFDVAIEATRYKTSYTVIYPVKVNQQQHVVEAITAHGGERVGLEAGSKPELLAVIGVSRAGGTIVCNGYKDAEYIRLALIAQRLGHEVVIVVERLAELVLIERIAKEMDLRPRLGVRVRLSAATSGNWQNTGGDRSKFGFTAAGMLVLMKRLRAAGLDDCLHMLHCHPGSQISGLDTLRDSLQETARTWVALREAGFPVDSVNVGGGLGVDYEGMASSHACSIDYDMQDYARTVVGCFADSCQQRQLPAPRLMSESGRALTAHHAVLITDVIDTEQVVTDAGAGEANGNPLLSSLGDCLAQCEQHPPLFLHARAGEVLEQLRAGFRRGEITLAQRARGESLYHALCTRLRDRLDGLRETSMEVEALQRQLADKYFCNLSVFQSMPDVWGIDQLFPIVPLQRLDERPQRHAILHDLSCDSDGHIEHYVGPAGTTASLPLHEPAEGESYLLGFFLLGAYQEILGDMHNLFGDTDAVNVELTADSSYRLVDPRRGDSAADLLRYVEFDPERLLENYRKKVRAAGLPDADACLQALQYGLDSMTYLNINKLP